MIKWRVVIVKRSKLKQELNVKFSVKYYQIMNKLTENLVKRIKDDTDLDVIPKAIEEKPNASLKRTIIFDGLIEDRDKKAERIMKMLKGINTVEQLKSFLEK